MIFPLAVTNVHIFRYENYRRIPVKKKWVYCRIVYGHIGSNKIYIKLIINSVIDNNKYFIVTSNLYIQYSYQGDSFENSGYHVHNQIEFYEKRRYHRQNSHDAQSKSAYGYSSVFDDEYRREKTCRGMSIKRDTQN